MRPAVVFGALALFGMATAPAWAASKYDTPHPSPCDRPIPTGLPLPRQGIIWDVGNVEMISTPTPTWRDRSIGAAGRSERVTILQECGFKLRIRTIQGLEGWINTVAIVEERLAYEKALHRKPETEADCDLLYIDAAVADRCKQGFTALKARQAEIETSPTMTADELRGFVVGRTIRLVERHPGPGIPPAPILSYGRPDGEYFLIQGKVNESGMRWRGHYRLDGDKVCYPGETAWCGRMRKVGGELMWTTPDGKDYVVTASDGDPYGLVAEVSGWYPHPSAPKAPAGSTDIAGPVSAE